ncbi:MAG: putative DNA modification/repair radical SAM protein [Clostridiales bacterium]|jgi:putative DNA modification/repair radical SAM protein|nr:putative DNA modification/repair radical SAM protein [Clostridiales bacterium]
MDMLEKLKILTDAAKYDVACTSSGVDRAARPGALGTAAACGICHSFAADGRCISLLKILQTNICVYDCQYCVNRRSNDLPRTVFTPEEVAELTIQFYRRNYIEGLFLSSAILKSPDYTMELMLRTLDLVRHKYNFNGYIHVKAIPGASQELVYASGLLADRMSANIELPSEESLNRLAPDKSKQAILTPMRLLRDTIVRTKNELTLYRHAPAFVPAGQSTQVIVGATPESDNKIITLAENLYKKYSLKRVFYSAFRPVPGRNALPTARPPLLREHRLYQADWLLRFYGFEANEIFNDADENLDLNMDPKCRWAIRNLEKFPVEITTAEYLTLLRVPGIGTRSAQRIMSARRVSQLNFELLKKMGIVLKRAKYFITCGGKMYEKIIARPEILDMKLSENKIGEGWQQVSLFDDA